MNTNEFFQHLDSTIAKYDLLCHPFYQAWANGKLTAEDLREYALDYYPQVKAFPEYLAEFAGRLEEGKLRNSVLSNMREENGEENGRPAGPTHAELWLDFAEGMGASRKDACENRPATRQLVEYFRRTAREGTPEEALAAFYAYESQVPRVAEEKARGLRENYGANDATCAYFTLHTTADRYHSQGWKHRLAELTESNPDAAQRALSAAESTAQMLWSALDEVESKRMSRAH